MAFDSTKVVATRDIKVYTVAWSSTNTVPADSVAWGTAWGTPSGQSAAYVEAGYTIGGVHFTTTLNRGEIRVDQELDPVLRPATGRETRMTTNLAEFKADNIVKATGQGATTTVAAGSGTRGHDDWDLTSTVANSYLTVGFDVLAPGDSEAIRFFGWKGLVIGTPTFDVVPEAALQIPLDVTLVPDTSASPARIAKIRDIIAAL